MGKSFSKSSRLLLCLVLTIVGVVAVACGSAEAPEPAEPDAPAPAAPAPAAPQPGAPQQPAAPEQPAAPAPAPTAAPAARPAPQPAPQGVEQSGDVVYALDEVDAMIGDPAIAPYRSWEASGTWSITEYLFVYENQDPMSPYLAESWEIAPDGSKVTIGVKEGIPWNSPPSAPRQDFGELTAEDVVWFMNRQNAFTNPESTSGDAGDFAAVFTEAELIDDYTLEIGLQTPTYFGLPLSQFGVLGAAPSMRSKAVFDKMGINWMRDHAVGTGPFVQKEWIANNRGVVEALPNHWHEPATINSLTLLQVPENTSRVAMVQSGQADMVRVDFKLVPGLVEEGLVFLNSSEGYYIGQSILYSGNLWEEVHPINGQPLGGNPVAPDYVDPWLAPPMARDIPWIGNPWCDMGKPCQYQDTNNPPGMSDMEQARLVRLALGTAIDRDAIVDVLLGGMGTPIYSEYMGPEYPGWDPDRVAQPVDWKTGEPIQNPGTTQQGIPWVLEYDPDRALELLEIAGYPDGFDATLQSYVAETGEITLEIADTVTSAWAGLGLNIIQKREDYGAVISPRMRQREQMDPVVKNGDVNANLFPLDWPYPPVDSALSRPGWGPGFETPVLSGNHLAIRGSKDKAFREQLHLETADYMIYWQLYNGIYQIPSGVIANPERIESWVSRPKHYGGAGLSENPQFLRMVGQ
jgi:ABC-type transport system substrate-binding protein